MTTGSDQPQDSKPLVLLIDDSVDVHRLLSARLRSEALTLAVASSGEEGLRLAGELKPAIILLDLNMDGMDGFEVLRRLKESSGTVSIPVIVLSGMTGAQDKVTSFDLGAVDYITKPFDMMELRVRVRSALRMHALLSLLSQRAQIDGLTGLWNRAYFDSRWREETASAGRHGRPLSVAVVDIDHFKSINDTFGHPAGDAVIQGVASLIQREGRQSDVACRYGGEEFVVIMPETAPRDAMNLCERVRVRLEQIRWPRHPERAVTASMGVAGTLGGAALTAEAWLEMADKNLYAAKQGGRNRVVVSDTGGKALKLAEAG